MSETGEQALARILRERKEATRPELASALGLSLVRVNALMPRLIARGEADLVGRRASKGGRPVALYRYSANFAWEVHIQIIQEGLALLVLASIYDGAGQLKHELRRRFAYMQENSLDDWLESHQTRPYARIYIEAAAYDFLPRLTRGLRRRFHAEVKLRNAAQRVSQEKEGTMTLFFPEQAVPLAAIWRNGIAESTGDLSLLPLPADWRSLDYEDRTLLEEMVARLLLCLCATHAPRRFALHAPFWTERLTGRIRYNLAAKLMNAPAPALEFVWETE